MPNYTTIATDTIIDRAIAAFNDLKPAQKNVWSLHTAIWEQLRSHTEQAYSRWYGTGVSEGMAIVRDYKRLFFDEDDVQDEKKGVIMNDWAKRDTAVAAAYSGGAAAVKGNVKKGVAYLLEKYDAFRAKFVLAPAQVRFRFGQNTFTGTIQVSQGAYDHFDGTLQQTATVLGVLSSSPIEFVPPRQMGNRGLKDKGDFIEVSTGAQIRLRGTPKGTFGQNGYKIVFDSLEAGH